MNPDVHGLHALTAGGRARFAPDSLYIAIYAKMGNMGRHSQFAFTGSIGFASMAYAIRDILKQILEK